MISDLRINLNLLCIISSFAYFALSANHEVMAMDHVAAQVFVRNDVSGEAAQGFLLIENQTCYVIVPHHLVASDLDGNVQRKSRQYEIIGSDGLKGRGDVEQRLVFDTAVIRVTENSASLCAAQVDTTGTGKVGQQLVTRSSLGTVQSIPFEIVTTQGAEIYFRVTQGAGEIVQGMSGGALLSDGKRIGMLINTVPADQISSALREDIIQLNFGLIYNKSAPELQDDTLFPESLSELMDKMMRFDDLSPEEKMTVVRNFRRFSSGTTDYTGRREALSDVGAPIYNVSFHHLKGFTELTFAGDYNSLQYSTNGVAFKPVNNQRHVRVRSNRFYLRKLDVRGVEIFREDLTEELRRAAIPRAKQSFLSENGDRLQFSGCQNEGCHFYDFDIKICDPFVMSAKLSFQKEDGGREVDLSRCVQDNPSEYFSRTSLCIPATEFPYAPEGIETLYFTVTYFDGSSARISMGNGNTEWIKYRENCVGDK